MVLNIILLCAAFLITAAFVFLYFKKRIGNAVLIGGIAGSFFAVTLAVVLTTVLNPLKFNLNGDSEVKLPVFSEFTDPGATAVYKKENISDKIEVTTTLDVNKIGNYDILYSIKQGKKHHSLKRKVSVVDEEKPIIVLNGDERITVSKYEFYSEPGVTATDNYDGDITANVKTEIIPQNGEYIIKYSVFDSSANYSETFRYITVKDIVSPKITLSGSGNMTLIVGTPYEEAGATAIDDVDGDITSKISLNGYVNTDVAGSYKMEYSVKDSSGNTASVTRKITVITQVEARSSRVCLTFDDGPSSSVTGRVLDILKQNDVKATFFICNYSDDKKPLLQRMIDEGHTIGIHGYSHDYSKIYSSDQAFMDNITSLRDKVYNDFGYTATVIRFPGGSSNTVSRNYSDKIMSRLTVKVKEAGFRYFDWNISSGDAEGNNIATRKLINNVKNGLVKNRANVVLMHDTDAKRTTAESLQEIIDYARNNGYSFSAIDDTVGEVHHGVNN